MVSNHGHKHVELSVWKLRMLERTVWCSAWNMGLGVETWHLPTGTLEPGDHRLVIRLIFFTWTTRKVGIDDLTGCDGERGPSSLHISLSSDSANQGTRWSDHGPPHTENAKTRMIVPQGQWPFLKLCLEFKLLKCIQVAEKYHLFWPRPKTTPSSREGKCCFFSGMISAHPCLEHPRWTRWLSEMTAIWTNFVLSEGKMERGKRREILWPSNVYSRKASAVCL